MFVLCGMNVQMKSLIIMFYICMPYKMYADEFRYGILLKLENNKGIGFNSDGSSLIQRQKPMNLAGGIYTAYGIGKRVFFDASLNLTRAKYIVNYVDGNSQFLDADVRKTELDLHVNVILNPDQKVCFYIGTGIEWQFRRWGEERYMNSIIQGTYWPDSRIVYQNVAGLFIKTSQGTGIQLFAGLNYNPEKLVIYDTEWNQTFVGMTITRNIQIKGINKINKSCPQNF